MSKFVSNKHGFTLLESLVALVVMSILLINMSLFVKVIITQAKSYNNESQVEVLATQMREELLYTDFYVLTPISLHISSYDRQFTDYIYTGKKLYRKRNLVGNELVFQNVKLLWFSENQSGIKLNVQFDSDSKIHEMYLGRPFLEIK